MEKKQGKFLRFSQEFFKAVDEGLTIENTVRAKNNETKLSQAMFIERCVFDQFNQKYKSNLIADVKDSERKYFIELVEKIFSTYFQSLSLQLTNLEESLQLFFAVTNAIHFTKTDPEKRKKAIENFIDREYVYQLIEDAKKQEMEEFATPSFVYDDE